MVQELVKSFTDNCWVPLSKELITQLRTADKSIKDLQVYFNAKKYNRFTNTENTDEKRYTDFTQVLVNFLSTNNISKLSLYTTNITVFMNELQNLLSSEYVYNALKVNFQKGSYGKIIDDLN